MTGMSALVSSMDQCLLFLPILNLTVIVVLLFAYQQVKNNTNLINEEMAVFLSLAKYAPLIFIALHFYFAVLFVPAFFVLSVPQSLCITWGLENSIIILLWLYVKFHYFRPVELRDKNSKLAV